MKSFIPAYLNIVCVLFVSLAARAAQSENMKSTGKPRLQVRGAVQDAISQAGESVRDAYAQAIKDSQEARTQSEKASRRERRHSEEAQEWLDEALWRIEEVPHEEQGRSEETREQSDENTVLLSVRRLRLQGRYRESAKLYRHFIANNPNSSRLFEARFWLAKSLFAVQEWDEAAEAFTEFIEYHSNHRMYSQHAKEDRIYCWKVRQKQNPKAILGLRTALKDPDKLIRVQAALALAENKDASGKKELEQGLNNDRLREQCALALWKLGLRGHLKPGKAPASLTRMLVVKVKTDDPDDSFEMRVPLNFLKGVEKMLPPEARVDLAHKGLSNLTELAATAPKGQILFQFMDGKTRVTISVDE
ncbi:MAG: tetratricopeptide repeat protein [Holophagales bacterium]|jgi:TolA-binding protein|nr:tetratricopeptide repeat protein [Holophagales bacterium]